MLGAALDHAHTTERERKYRLLAGERERVSRQLAAEASWLRGGTEADLFFDHPLLELRARDRALRLRLREPGGGYELTYKGPREYRGADTLRGELASPVDPGVARVLHALGFVVTQQFVKLREVHRAWGCEISLDVMEGVGTFCEIEADEEDADLDAVATRLGLSAAQLEPKTYAELVDEAAARG